MRRTTLTNSLINRSKPTATEYTIWDNGFKGLGVRIRIAGSKKFILNAYIGDSLKKVTLCDFPNYTIEDAREIAAKKYEELVKSFNSGLKINKEKLNLTFTEVCNKYMAEYSNLYKKPTTAKSDSQHIKCRLIPELGHLKANDIKAQHIAEFHAKYSHSPYSANRILALISHIFNWAMQMDLIELRLNPCQYIKKYKEEKRERYLTTEEMQRLNDALNLAIKIPPIPDNSIKAIKLLMLTGCRRNEILNLTWDEVDFEHKVLRLKDSKTGKKDVPVSDAALSIIKTIPKIKKNPYVITGKFAEHITCLKRSWDRVRKLAGIPELRIHDLRHNFASIGVCNNLSLEVIGRILGHSSTSTTKRYAHLQDSPVRNGINQISQAFENIIDIK